MKRHPYYQCSFIHLGKYIAMVCLLFCIPISCKSFRNVEKIKPSLKAEYEEGKFNPKELGKLRMGDLISVQTNKAMYVMRFKNIESGEVKGLLETNPLTQKRLSKTERYEIGIPISEIEIVKVSKFNAPATVGLSAGALVGIYMLWVLALLNSEITVNVN